MFENESNKVRQDIDTLQRMLDFDEFEANGGDLFKIEWALNTALDHIEFLKSNLPYDHMNDDVEDEVVECDALVEKPKSKRLSQDAQFRLFVVILLAAIIIACLIFCD